MADTSAERKFGSGLWWSGRTWTVRSIGEEGGPLPVEGEPWRPVPAWLLLPAAPLVGGAFLVVLPVVGAALLARALLARLAAGGREAARDLAAAVTAPAPRPGEAHLTGAPPDGTPAEARPPAGAAGDRTDDAERPGGALGDVEAEVERARRKG
jgi:hypothetical protein